MRLRSARRRVRSSWAQIIGARRHVSWRTPMVQPPAFEHKIVSPENLEGRLRSLARPLVFTNGVFDVLHRGHVTYLAESRALGATLILALNSDSSVKRLGKGDDRPVNPLEDRAAVAAALESVR